MSSALRFSRLAAKALVVSDVIASTPVSSSAPNFSASLLVPPLRIQEICYSSTNVIVAHRLGFSSTLCIVGLRSRPSSCAEYCIRRL